VLVDAARERVTGIIDFGDCVHTCLVFELAICIAYMLLGKDDVQAVARHIYKGYAARIPLTPDEKALLHCLIAARLAQSVTMGLAPRPAPRAPRPAPRAPRRPTRRTGGRRVLTLQGPNQRLPPRDRQDRPATLQAPRPTPAAGRRGARGAEAGP